MGVSGALFWVDGGGWVSILGRWDKDFGWIVVGGDEWG